MSTQIGSTNITQASYQMNPTASSETVKPESLKAEIDKSGLPDLIGMIIRLIAANAQGNFLLDVSQTKATLTLNSPPPTTIVIASTANGWTKTVTKSGQAPTTTPIFQNHTENTEYTKLTTLFITTVGNARNSPTSLPTSATPSPLQDREGAVSPPLSQPVASSPTESQDLNARLHEAEAEMRSLQEKHQELETLKTRLETDLSQAQAKYNDLNAKHDELERAKRDLQGHLEAAHQVNEDSKAAMAALKAQIEELENSKKTIETELQEVKEEAARKEQLLASKEEEINTVRQALREAEEKNQELSAKLETETKDKTEAMEARQQALRQLEETRNLLTQSQETHRLMEDQLAKTPAKLGELQQEKDKIESQLLALQKELKTVQDLNEKYNLYAKENETLKGKLHTESNENNRLKAEMQRMTLVMQSAQEKIAALARQNETVTDQMRLLQEKETKELRDRETLTNENKKLRDQIESLRKSLAQYEGIEQQLGGATDLADKQKKAIADIARQLQASEKKFTQMEETLAEDRRIFKEELASKHEKIKQLLQELSQLKKLTPSAELEQERNDLQEQLTTLQTQHAKALAEAQQANTQSLESLKAKEMEYKAQVKMLKERQEATSFDFQARLKSLIEKNKVVDAELRKAYEEIEELKRGQESSLREWNEISGSNAALSEELSTLKNNVKMYATALIEAENNARIAAKKARDEKDALSASYADDIADMEEKFKKTEDTLKAQNQRLSTRIQELEKEIETLKATSSTSSSQEVAHFKRQLAKATKEVEDLKEALEEHEKTHDELLGEHHDLRLAYQRLKPEDEDFGLSSLEPD